MNQRIRVLIADDQQPIRQGLKALLNYVPQIEVIDEAVNGEEAVRLAAKYQPDVVLMDMQMPLMDGIQATRLIKARWPQVESDSLNHLSTLPVKCDQGWC
jgi:YesN/AraC family two-component response regulator